MHLQLFAIIKIDFFCSLITNATEHNIIKFKLKQPIFINYYSLTIIH